MSGSVRISFDNGQIQLAKKHKNLYNSYLNANLLLAQTW